MGRGIVAGLLLPACFLVSQGASFIGVSELLSQVHSPQFYLATAIPFNLAVQAIVFT
jgi:hypothetical protein